MFGLRKTDKRESFARKQESNNATISSSQNRLFTRYIFPSRGYAPFAAYKVNHTYMNILTRNCFANPSSNKVPHHAQTSWRRISNFFHVLRLRKTDNEKRLFRHIFAKRGSIHSERRNNAATTFSSSQNRHIFPNINNGAYWNTLTRNYIANPLSNKVQQLNAQIAWKRISKSSYLYNRQNTSLGKMAQSVCLALRSRSYIVLPVMTCGNHLLAQSSPRDMGPTSLYKRAQDVHMYMTPVLSSLFEGMVLLYRTIFLTILFSPSIAMAPFADCFGAQFRKVWLMVVHHSLERAGPAFIKWGQWAATRPDLFPRDLCKELSKLHMKAPEHSFAYSKKTIEEAFGRELSEIFSDFKKDPEASGSIAQVHKATLKYPYCGQENIKPMVVAVKVRHPGVGDSIRRDFQIISVIAKCLTLIPSLKWLRLDESVEQFATFMMSQVDLTNEAANLTRFLYNFRGKRGVSFPKPVYPLVSPDVLVESFEQGESVACYVDDELEGHNTRLKRKIAHIGTEAYLKMVLEDNFIHADWHPGNIFIYLDQNKKPHVKILDAGMTAELSRTDKENLLEFFTSVARRDGRRVAEYMLRLSKQQNCPNPEAFIHDVKVAFDFWATPEGNSVHPGDCLHHLLEQVRQHRVNVDSNVCTVLVTTLVLEGWQRKLDPDYDIMRILQKKLLKRDWLKSKKAWFKSKKAKIGRYRSRHPAKVVVQPMGVAAGFG